MLKYIFLRKNDLKITRMQGYTIRGFMHVYIKMMIF